MIPVHHILILSKISLNKLLKCLVVICQSYQKPLHFHTQLSVTCLISCNRCSDGSLPLMWYIVFTGFQEAIFSTFLPTYELIFYNSFWGFAFFSPFWCVPDIIHLLFSILILLVISSITLLLNIFHKWLTLEFSFTSNLYQNSYLYNLSSSWHLFLDS